MSNPPSDFSHIPVYAERDRKHIERTAYHEAGHAVMALAAGRRFVAVTVSSTERLLGNVSSIQAGLDVRLLRQSEAGRHILTHQEWITVLITLAGPVAEWMEKGSVRNTAGDLFQAVEHLQAIRPGLALDTAVRLAQRQRRRVRALLDQAWPAVDSLARELVKKGTVDHESAEAIYWDALPHGVPFDLFRCPLREGRDAEMFFAAAQAEAEET